jgi:hypothetical protein
MEGNGSGIFLDIIPLPGGTEENHEKCQSL